MGILQKLSSFLRGADQEERAPDMRQVEQLAAVPEMAEVNRSTPAQAPEPIVPTPKQEPPVRPPAPQQETEPRSVGVKRVVLDEARLRILDLRELPSSRFRIVGSSFWITDAGRYKHGGSDYLLVREPKNKWDVNAVAVYGNGRKVGHLSEAKAAALAPILDELTFDAYRVGGAPPADNSIRMWVDVPAIPKLRTFARSLGKERG